MNYLLDSKITTKNPTIKLDGSKSISNRLLILQQVSKTPFKITNLSTSDDSVLMQKCINEFSKTSVLNVENAGTVTRFITAFLANQKGEWTLNCAEPMKKRPIKILVDVLNELGAEITYLEEEGYLPIHIKGKQLTSKTVKMHANVSSQYISALMMIAPSLPNGLQIELIGDIASKPYLEITQKCMEQCGFHINFNGNIINILAGQLEPEKEIFNESDWSAIAFYYTLLSFSSFDSFTILSLLPQEVSTQGDAIVAEYFSHLGIKTQYLPNNIVRLEKTNELIPRKSFDFFDCPDLVPAFSLACAVAGYETKFTGVQNLVIKESNRLVAMQNELKKLGVNFHSIDKNTWALKGKVEPHLISSTVINTYHDHRIAMTFGTLGFLNKGLIINDPGVVSKSYTKYWHDLRSIGLHTNETISA